jgi:hypothetical protein
VKAMIARGEYPKQSAAGQKKSSVTMGFEKCKLSTDTVLNQLGGYYPKEVIISTSIIHTSKMWANDGTVSITCSKLDNKMIIVESKYEDKTSRTDEKNTGSVGLSKPENEKLVSELIPNIYPEKAILGAFNLKLDEVCLFDECKNIINYNSVLRHGLRKVSVSSKKITNLKEIFHPFDVHIDESTKKIKYFRFSVYKWEDAERIIKSMEKSYGIKFPNFSLIKTRKIRASFYSIYFDSKNNDKFKYDFYTAESLRKFFTVDDESYDIKYITREATEVRFKNASIIIDRYNPDGDEIRAINIAYETHEHRKIVQEGFSQLLKDRIKKDPEPIDSNLFK